MKYRLKFILGEVNSLFVNSYEHYIQKDIKKDKLFHPNFLKHKLAIANGYKQDFLNFYLSQNKLKIALTFFNRQFDNIERFPYRNNPYVKGGAKTLIWATLIAIISSIAYKEYSKREYTGRIKSGATAGLAKITSKQVLYSDQVVNETAKLIVRLCETPRIQYHTANSLNRVIQMRTVKENAEKLALRFIHQNLVYEEHIYKKLKGVVIGQLRSTDRRTELMHLLMRWLKTEGGKETAINGWVGGLGGPATKKIMNYTAKTGLVNALSDENTRLALKEKVDSILGKR